MGTALLVIGIVIVVAIISVVLYINAGPADGDYYKPKFRGYKNIDGNVVTDMRSDAEIDEDASNVF